MRTTRLLLSVPIVAAVFSLAACAAGDGAGVPKGFMDRAGVQAEYDEVVKHFPYPLPKGVSFPAKIQPEASGQRTIYQKGSGLTQAYQYWQCAWQASALDAQGSDPSTVDKALAELERGLGSVYQTQYFEDPDGVWKKTIDEAKLGDLSGLGEFYQSDCTWYRTENGR